jgi:hypothetical protein
MFYMHFLIFAKRIKSKKAFKKILQKVFFSEKKYIFERIFLI